MRWPRFLFAVMLVLPVFACGGSGGDSNNSELEGRIQRMVEEKFAEYAAEWPGWTGGLALKVVSPAGKYFAATGFDAHVGDETHFRGASTTKTFTAACILKLQQDGKLDIDHLITDTAPETGEPYLPDSADYDIPYKSQITIRQLLEHRAGVFDITNDPVPATADAPYNGTMYVTWVRETQGEDHTFTFDELVGVVASNQLSYFPPGQEFHYSNIGYDMLGKIIERLSGMSYGEYVAGNFLVSNELDGTSFPHLGDDVDIPAPYADGYTWWDGISYPTTEDNMSAHVAEGNIISTLDDLSRWVKRIITGKAGLTKEFVAMMTDVQPTGEHHEYYGLGCTWTEGLGYGHNGGHVGYMTVMRYDPEVDVTVVLFMSDINAMDVNGQGVFMYEVGRSAREILGYSADSK